MSKGKLFDDLLETSPKPSACLVSGILVDKLALKLTTHGQVCSKARWYHRLLMVVRRSVFCGKLCKTEAQEVCQVLENALNSETPTQTAVSELKNPPLHIVQMVCSSLSLFDQIVSSYYRAGPYSGRR